MMSLLLPVLALVTSPEQSLDKAAVEAGRLRQVLEVKRCAELAPCPKPTPCPVCATCQTCPDCAPCTPAPVLAPTPSSKLVRFLFAAGGFVAGAVIVGIAWGVLP
jgi:hypothetical protein